MPREANEPAPQAYHQLEGNYMPGLMPSERAKRNGRWRLWVSLSAVGLLTLAVVTGAVWLVTHIEPIMRDRIVQTLADRFEGDVELGAVHITAFPRITVSGEHLVVHHKGRTGTPPLIQIGKFSFTARFPSLGTPVHVSMVQVNGLEIQVPPRSERTASAARSWSKNAAPQIVVDRIACDDAKLTILPGKPGKVPLDFDIHQLSLRSVGPNRPMSFEATLTNPKPVGDIQTRGDFGPWQGDDPAQTPVSGVYSFTNADLSTLHGIAGILSSNGKFHGSLERIEVSGQTDTPDFRASVSGHPVPLHTDFNAIVDGTNGETYLQPVRARFLHSSLVAVGSVLKMPDGHGHDIRLEVTIDNARIEDLLRLALKADKPALSGAVRLKTNFHLPAGDAEVPDRLQLNAVFNVAKARLGDPDVQDKVDRLSLRSQGKPKEAAVESPHDVLSHLKGRFILNHGVVSFSDLRFDIPGASIELTGNYGLRGEDFDFHGKARLQAKLSQMTTGFKSFLLKALDPFFKKDGVGAVLPIKIAGTKDTPSFQLDLGHKAEKTALVQRH